MEIFTVLLRIDTSFVVSVSVGFLLKISMTLKIDTGTVCLRSLDPFYTVSYYIKLAQDFLDRQYGHEYVIFTIVKHKG